MVRFAAIGCLESAVECVDEALVAEPSNTRLRLDRAALLGALGERRRALEDVEAVLAEELHVEALVLRALCLEEEDRKEAAATLDRALELAPNYAEARLQRARLWLEEGRIREAASLMRTELEERARAQTRGDSEGSPDPRPSLLWLSLAPDVGHEASVGWVIPWRHARFVDALRRAHRADTLAVELAARPVDETNVREAWRSLADISVPCDLPDAVVAKVTSAHAVLRERVFVASLVASAARQLDGHLEAAYLHAKRAASAAPAAHVEAVRARCELLRVETAAFIASEAAALLPIDAWRADVRARRAVELEPTREHRVLADRVAVAVCASQPTYVKTLGARREKEGLVVTLQLGADSGLMVAPPGVVGIDIDGVVHEFDVVADDYVLEEVRLGDEIFWERTWTSPPIPRAADVRQLRVRFTVEGGATLVETRRLRE